MAAMVKNHIFFFFSFLHKLLWEEVIWLWRRCLELLFSFTVVYGRWSCSDGVCVSVFVKSLLLLWHRQRVKYGPIVGMVSNDALQE